MIKIKTILVTCFASLLVAATVVGGLRNGQITGVTTQYGNLVGWATLVQTRYSSNSTDLAYCWDYGSYGSCLIRDAEGDELYCTTTDTVHLAVIRSMSAQDSIRVVANLDGDCLNIGAGHTSHLIYYPFE
jgi:hypothetical protein